MLDFDDLGDLPTNAIPIMSQCADDPAAGNRGRLHRTLVIEESQGAYLGPVEQGYPNIKSPAALEAKVSAASVVGDPLKWCWELITSAGRRSLASAAMHTMLCLFNLRECAK